MASRDAELRDVLRTLSEDRPSSDAPVVANSQSPRGDIALMFTWAGCLLATIAILLVGYTNFVAQDSSPKQIAAMALTFLELGATYIVARCVHELVMASRRTRPTGSR